MKNILKKLHSIQKDIGTMKKDGFNDHSKYNYLSETQVTALMKDLFDKHGVIFGYSSKITSKERTPSEKQVTVDVEVSYSFIDTETGEMLHGTAVGQGSDQTDKGVYKAITGAIKYIYMKTFNIPTGDDPERDTPKKIDGKSHLTTNDEVF